MFEILKFTLLCAILNSFGNASLTTISCKNESGIDVDWFFLYKLPREYKTSGVKNSGSGYEYAYLSGTNPDYWILSQELISDSTSMPALTLNPMYEDKDVLVIAYNDEFPDGRVHVGGGHTKGVLLADSSRALWLIHSVPKYPSADKYSYPPNGKHYGQSFMCISLAMSELETVAVQLLYNQPSIYIKKIPDWLGENYPNLHKAIDKKWINKEPFFNVVDISSYNGQVLKSFAKTPKFNNDLYADLVAPTLSVDLWVESWRNGRGNLPSYCSKTVHSVMNVESVTLKNLDISFSTTNDHSKWAVSVPNESKVWNRFFADKSIKWVCVGDINRQEHQYKRGGGVLCFSNPHVVEVYREMVKTNEKCKKTGFFNRVLNGSLRNLQNITQNMYYRIAEHF